MSDEQKQPEVLIPEYIPPNVRLELEPNDQTHMGIQCGQFFFFFKKLDVRKVETKVENGKRTVFVIAQAENAEAMRGVPK